MTDSTKADIAAGILNPVSFDTKTLREMLKGWDLFVPFPPRRMTADEGEVFYIESLYDQMRPYAFEWLTDYRLRKLEAVSPGPRLGPTFANDDAS